jgi:hypothetical protein
MTLCVLWCWQWLTTMRRCLMVGAWQTLSLSALMPNQQCVYCSMTARLDDCLGLTGQH